MLTETTGSGAGGAIPNRFLRKRDRQKMSVKLKKDSSSLAFQPFALALALMLDGVFRSEWPPSLQVTHSSSRDRGQEAGANSRRKHRTPSPWRDERDKDDVRGNRRMDDGYRMFCSSSWRWRRNPDGFFLSPLRPLSGNEADSGPD